VTPVLTTHFIFPDTLIKTVSLSVRKDAQEIVFAARTRCSVMEDVSAREELVSVLGLHILNNMKLTMIKKCAFNVIIEQCRQIIKHLHKLF